MTYLKKLLVLLKEFNITKTILHFRFKGYLVDEGWFLSYAQSQPLGKANNPIPWWTYSMNDFLTPRLHKCMNIFEWGSGNSTLYLANLVNTVISVEHDKDWFKMVAERAPKNVQLIFRPLDYSGEYCNAIASQEVCFDVVVIDGRDRVNCCINSIPKLKPDGVVVFDDTQGKKYEAAFGVLKEKGFKRLDFTGIAAGYFFKKSTTVFYRHDNCLGI